MKKRILAIAAAMLLSVSSLLGTGSAVLAAETDSPAAAEAAAGSQEETPDETETAEAPEEETEDPVQPAAAAEEEADTPDENESDPVTESEDPVVPAAEQNPVSTAEDPSDPAEDPEPDEPVPATYKITYKLRGGSYSSGSNPAEFVIGSTPVALKKLTRVGYTFGGWYQDTGFTKKVTKLNDALFEGKDPSEKLVLYAKWTIKTYTITYVPRAQKATLSKKLPTTFKHGTFPAAQIIEYKPTRPEYVFASWYLDKEYKTKLTAKDLRENPRNIRVYARWRYPIKYALQGGTNNSKNPKTYLYTDTIKLRNPKKRGYEFKGWYTDKARTKKITTIKKGSSGKVLLYAKWKKKTYTITYNLRGGTNVDGNPATYTITSRKIILQKPTRYAYTFLGWYKDKECTKQVKSIKKGSAGDKVLYAKWKKGFDPQILIDTAMNEIGYHEKRSAYALYDKTANKGYGSDNYTKYALDLHRVTSAVSFPCQWCDAFVNWCFMEAYGVTDGARILGGAYYAYNGSNAAQYRRWGRWSSTPHVGDQLFLKEPDGFLYHTAIVYKVTDTHIFVIEGNHDDQVGKRAFYRNNPKISGYGRPLYDVL